MNKKNDFGSLWRNPVFVFALISLIAVCVLFFFLGKWQWDRTQNILEAERAAAAEPVAAELVLADQLRSEDFGRTVKTRGTYNPINQVRVTNRLDGGGDQALVGEWIVSQFITTSGISVAVVRGWVPAGSEFVTAEGQIDISGVLQPNEAFYQGSGVSSSEVVVIDSDALETVWGVELSDGFIVLQQQDPTASGEPLPVPATISTADVPFPLQNFFYAIQWWIFAGFAVILFIRWVLVSSRKTTDQ